MRIKPLFSFEPHPIVQHGERLRMDGELDEHSQVTNYGHARSAYVTQERIISRLLEMKCCDLAEMFATVSFPLYPRPHEFVDGVMFNWMMPRGERGPRLEFTNPLNLRDWHRPWSIPDFIDQLQRSALDLQFDVQVHDPTSRGAIRAYSTISFLIEDQSRTAFEVLGVMLPAVVGLLDVAANRLDERAEPFAVLTTYGYPPEVAQAAFRYLEYFAQFLRDLGIESSPELKRHAGLVVLRMEFDIQGEARERIVEALRIYLQLPSLAQFAAVSAPLTDPAVIQLRAEVLNLQSQLDLARATIDMLQIANYHYRQICLPPAALRPLSNQSIDSPISERPREKDDPLPISIKFKLGPLEVDVLALLRLLRRKIRKL